MADLVSTYLVTVTDEVEHPPLEAAITTGRDLYLGNGVMRTKIDHIVRVQPTVSYSKGSAMGHVEADYPLDREAFRRIYADTTPEQLHAETAPRYRTIEPPKPDAITRLARVVTILVLKGLVTESELGMPVPLAFGEFVMQADIEGWLRS